MRTNEASLRPDLDGILMSNVGRIATAEGGCCLVLEPTCHFAKGVWSPAFEFLSCFALASRVLHDG